MRWEKEILPRPRKDFSDNISGQIPPNSAYTHQNGKRTQSEFNGKLRVLQPALGVAGRVAILCQRVEPARAVAHADADFGGASGETRGKHGGVE